MITVILYNIIYRYITYFPIRLGLSQFYGNPWANQLERGDWTLLSWGAGGCSRHSLGGLVQRHGQQGNFSGCAWHTKSGLWVLRCCDLWIWKDVKSYQLLSLCRSFEMTLNTTLHGSFWQWSCSCQSKSVEGTPAVATASEAPPVEVPGRRVRIDRTKVVIIAPTGTFRFAKLFASWFSARFFVPIWYHSGLFAYIDYIILDHSSCFLPEKKHTYTLLHVAPA